jgi:transposase-like protein
MASSSARYRVTQPLGSPPTLRTGYVRVQVYCNSCRHQADADLRALVLRGQGDVPLTELRFRCAQCGSDRTDFVVTSRDNPQPW